jgi:hypothetical protein
VLGEPDYVDNSGEDKVNYSWDLETEEGDVVTLYTWKEYRPIEVDEDILFHIGGMARNHTILGKQEITELTKIFEPVYPDLDTKTLGKKILDEMNTSFSMQNEDADGIW